MSVNKKYLFYVTILATFASFLVRTNLHAQIPPYIPGSGLKAWYPFTGNANDSSGYAAHGTPYGSVTYGTDRFGNAGWCYVGDGATGINIPNTNLPVGNSSRSISAWYKSVLPYPGSERQIMAWGNNIALGQRWGIYTDGSVIGLEYRNGSVVASTTLDSTWHNIIVTYPTSGSGSSSVKVYVDGSLTSSSIFVPVSSFATDTGDIHTIGTLFLPTSSLYSWIGSLDDVGIWDRAVTDCEIWQIYHNRLWSLTNTIVGSDTVCIGSTLPLSDTLTGGTWTSVYPSIASVTGSGTVIGIAPGTDTIYYTVSSACGTSVGKHAITVIAAPHPDSITGPNHVCPTAAITIASHTAGGTWSATNGNATVSSGTVTGVHAGQDTILYSINNTCGITTDSLAVTIDPLPNAGTISGQAFVCAGATITLSETTTGGTWRVDNANATIDATGTLTGIAGGSVTVSYTTTNVCGSASATYVVSVTNIPGSLAGLPVFDTSFCLGTPVPLHTHYHVANDTFSTYSYLWSPGTGLDNPTLAMPAFYGLGDYTYTLTITSSPAGCTAVEIFRIHAQPPITLTNVTANAQIAAGASVQLDAAGALYYTWTPNDGTLSDPNINNPIATPTDSVTVYRVIGMSHYGCKDTAEVTIHIYQNEDGYMPAAFTPNGDGLNDVFRLVNYKWKKLVDFRIFNRWGQEVFQTTDVKRGWDGTFNGTPQDIGTYYYHVVVATPDGGEKTISGNVSLIR